MGRDDTHARGDPGAGPTGVEREAARAWAISAPPWLPVPGGPQRPPVTRAGRVVRAALVAAGILLVTVPVIAAVLR